jgi:5-methylcytosine-specific restriction protein A
MTSGTYNTRTWRRVRMLVLARDNYTCTIQLAGCTHTATEADHITPLAAGGHPYAMHNLRAACKPCNASLGATYGNQAREPRSEAW